MSILISVTYHIWLYVEQGFAVMAMCVLVMTLVAEILIPFDRVRPLPKLKICALICNFVSGNTALHFLRYINI